MRIAAVILRVVSGLILLFAGAVKLNDPVAYAVKLNEYFDQIKKDAAVKQDTLLITLQDGLKTLNSASFRLYAGETAKTLLIRQEMEVITPKIPVDSSNIDTLQKVKKSKKKLRSRRKIQVPKSTYLVRVNIFLDGIAAGDTSILFKDSGTATLLSLQAKIRNQSVFQKSFKVAATNSVQEQKSDLMVESFVKNESKMYRFFNGAKSYNIGISMALCLLEFLIGFSLLIGWGKRFTLGLNIFGCLLLISLSLYGYSRATIAETGAFGQGISLSPFLALLKDGTLMLSAILLFIFYGHFTPLFSRKTGIKVMLVVTLLSGAFGTYSYGFLPLWDVSAFGPGCELNPTAVIELKTGNKPRGKGNIAAFDQIIRPGFTLYDAKINRNLTDSFLNNPGYKLLLVMPFIENAYSGSNARIEELHKLAEKKKMIFMASTATPWMLADGFAKKNNWAFRFVNADKGLLERMAGFNPTLYLIKKNKVVKKWSGLYLPNESEIINIIER